MRFIARYAKELEKSFEIVTVYENEIQKEKISKENPSIKTLAKKHPCAIWFERKMHDDFGIVIEDAFDARPLVHQERFPKNIHPLRKNFQEKKINEAPYVQYKYEAIKGDGVFQVAVGPIHAGIIEPGHFQFSQAGEEMLHLEVRHFYKNRGIEKMAMKVLLIKFVGVILHYKHPHKNSLYHFKKEMLSYLNLNGLFTILQI